MGGPAHLWIPPVKSGIYALQLEVRKEKEHMKERMLLILKMNLHCLLCYKLIFKPFKSCGLSTTDLGSIEEKKDNENKIEGIE